MPTKYLKPSERMCTMKTTVSLSSAQMKECQEVSWLLFVPAGSLTSAKVFYGSSTSAALLIDIQLQESQRNGLEL